MAEIDSNLIGSVINALPLDRMIGGPLQAMVNAQVQASRAYADFLMEVCFDKQGDDGAGTYLARNIQFDYDETLVDDQGMLKGTHRKTMRIPLVAAITHPNICVEEGTVDFDLSVTQSLETNVETSAEGGFKAKVGWGPFSVSMHGKVSHKSKQTRKTDTTAKYSIHVGLKRQEPPESMARVIDFLTDAATKPVCIAASGTGNAEVQELPADSGNGLQPVATQ